MCVEGGAEEDGEKDKAKLWQPSDTYSNPSSAAFNPDMVHIRDKARACITKTRKFIIITLSLLTTSKFRWAFRRTEREQEKMA